jgi:serine/threonine protein kinase/Flp pilus assembly protein TadD
MKEAERHEMALFGEALDYASREEQTAYLDRECGDSPALRARVEALLAAHHQAGDFLDGRKPPGSAVDALGSESPGAVIGPYKLMEQIGEGGMGLVFVAEQQQPVRRKVAVKVIKPGMDTREVIARFEAERQALALMDHPNIARVFDAGATASGRPYFVMELVRGVDVIQFCDQNRLTPRERLELFVHVCQAVQHAHQKGIIHRDLKATNILVTLHDGTPVVKVIDFGVAKAIGQQLTDKTVYTRFAQMIGTPMYMSPEQAEMSGLDVDTRSDIYALGVLLYELLTGATPFDKERLRTAAFDEIRRIIREEEPPRPSTRFSTLEQATVTLSASRKSDPRRLSQLFRGELDWIVMKALAKDRSRRYDTAAALAADVGHFLRHEPVEACPPSAWYRFRKFASRNRAALAAASVGMLIVFLGVIGLGLSNARIRQEQSRTQDEKSRAEEAQKLAEQRAEQNRLGLESLKTANALLERGRHLASIHDWDGANAAFSKALELRPDHDPIWWERSTLYGHLGLPDLAVADLAKALRGREPNVTHPWYRYALLNLYHGDVAGYRATCRQLRESFGTTVVAAFAEEVVRTCALGPDPDADVDRQLQLMERDVASHPFWYTFYLLGVSQFRAGRNEEAVQKLSAAIAGSGEWRTGKLAYPVLAMAYQRLGQTAAARRALDDAKHTLDQWLQQRYEVPGGDWVVHRGTASPIWPVVWWDWLEFEIYYRQACVLIDGAAPVDDPRVHVLRARACAGLHRRDMAIVEFDAALKLNPADRQVLLEAHRNRGQDHVQRQEWSRAAAEFRRACELRPEDARLRRFQAVADFAAADLGAYRQTCADMLEQFSGTQDPLTACNVLHACVLGERALPDAARLLPLAELAAPAWHYGAWTRGAALYRAREYDQAARCFEDAARLYEPRVWDWCFLAMAHARLGHADRARRCLDQAERSLEAADHSQTENLEESQSSWRGWDEQAVYPLVLREAREVLKTIETR